MSQHEVAEELGITRRQVASIETKAIRKIKNYFKKNRIKKEDLI
jgi:DNA-directed RNA polymerase sigma subunit (sigma70/sigma32)